MATKKKPRALADLASVTDPTAPIDSPMLLKAAQPVLKQLEGDLTQRAKGSPAVTLALKARHKAEQDARRTADAYPQWLEHFVEQVAAAWLLSCVFVRTLEDRGLLAQNRIAGPGALDSQRVFLELAPSLSERDYLLFVFRELTRLPAAKALFDARHNPVWMLAPSAEASKALLQLFRAPHADAPALRFGQPDTRVLGDLYQDLNANVRKRYALLQTPDFVESFILDRTLEPAIQKFGLDAADLIDPTCGSGHFLLGAFARLYDHQLRHQPGLSPREAARLALDKVYGADINPYAVAVARFRLTLAYLEKAGFKKLGEAPELPLHVVVADSLLHNPQLKLDTPGTIDRAVQTSFLDMEQLDAEARAEFGGREYQLEDPEEARAVLTRKFAAVVGNPPYITVKDAVLRERYREMYPSAAGKYAVSVPFTERFFHLGRLGARVGMITANSFMKREFGKKLIEAFLPTVNLDLIVNTSGAYIPGHGTPTVLLFGSAEEPTGGDVRAVLAKRGEPSTPADPEQGEVWRSIVDHHAEVGFENEYVNVAEVPRGDLAGHPWSLAGGGAGDLKSLLEESADCVLGDVAAQIGISCVTGEDEVYLLPRDVALRSAVGRTIPLVTGDGVRDWSLSAAAECVFPYGAQFDVRSPGDAVAELRYLWPFRTNLSQRKRFGKPMLQRGLTWYELQELYANKLQTPLTITFAFVATHNHFVLDRGGKVFNRSAPIIKLPESATEDDHLTLLAYLNSSTACFWMKQVMHNKGQGGVNEGLRSDVWDQFHEFSGTPLKALPVPERTETCVELARALLERRARMADIPAAAVNTPVAEHGALREEYVRLARELVSLQEQLDWHVYGLFGIIRTEAIPALPTEIEAGRRPFEFIIAENDLRGASNEWFRRNGYTAPPLSECHLLQHVAAIRSNKDLSLLEQPEYKRPWRFPSFDELHRAALAAAISVALEEIVAGHEGSKTRQNIVSGVLADAQWRARAESYFGDDAATHLADDLEGAAVPYLAALRFTDAGLTKHAQWQRTWDLQRQEDAGVKLAAPIPVPPKYDQKDYRDSRYWSLRGKLDVPKERFISYPGCESDEDGEPVYGWAGWDHLQRAQALVALYNDRKTREGWDKDRLTPMLAGLLELIPWLKQWHNEPNAEFDGLRMGDSYEAFLDGECRALGLTPDSLLRWRPVR